MAEAWVSQPSMFFISHPSDSVADYSHSSSDSLSAGQMLIVFIIGSYVNARTYPVSLLTSPLMCVSALMLSPAMSAPPPTPPVSHLSGSVSSLKGPCITLTLEKKALFRAIH